GIAGGAGTFLGGFLADKLARKDRRWYMWIPAIGFLIAVPFSIGVYLVAGLYAALAFYIVPAFMVNLYAGPTFGMTQSLAPLVMRSSASALLLFIINIIGLVFGPTTVGLLSDLFQNSWGMDGTEGLKWALFACAFVYVISFINFMMAGKYLRQDLAVAEANS
ncbi:MAG: MFS family permease, partial [Planctomycetaceae bacterium]